jgi:hypothetical protein
MKNYTGRKIRGFSFNDIKDVAAFASSMEKCIGKVGEIISETRETVMVRFRYDSWHYPISLIEPHLIEEETPEIPQLGEGVLMQVSDDGIKWCERYVIAKSTKGFFAWHRDVDYINNILWKYARPIPQLPKYTHAELVEKLGEDFIYEK